MKQLKLLTLATAAALLSSCSSPTVSYVDPNAVNSLTTNFTQNDLRTVAQDMSQDLIQSGKMNRCKTYTISPVKNATDQYVDTSVMTNAMSDALSNSSAVTSEFVVSDEGMSNQTGNSIVKTQNIITKKLPRRLDV